MYPYQIHVRLIPETKLSVFFLSFFLNVSVSFLSSLCLSLSLFLSLCLYRSFVRLSLSLSLSLCRCFSVCLSVSLSLSHTHTRMLSLSLCVRSLYVVAKKQLIFSVTTFLCAFLPDDYMLSIERIKTFFVMNESFFWTLFRMSPFCATRLER